MLLLYNNIFISILEEADRFHHQFEAFKNDYSNDLRLGANNSNHVNVPRIGNQLDPELPK